MSVADDLLNEERRRRRFDAKLRDRKELKSVDRFKGRESIFLLACKF